PKPSGGGGGGKGQQIADYACRFIGNPYVAGGTSLTNGADCSGFVMSVFKNFGISLPRSSYSQSTVGRAVSYSEAKPGDIIYYGGHVGIYIGNGQIVHASTQRTGIKITSATYRNIITIRRIV
ncbi:MAG: C40 family peptidase, partial [Lachnospiraceae bacterium]|nr:C40 family peptidase [Lachnospiraceae bacterium]